MVDEDDEEGQFEVCVKGLSFQAYDSDIRALFESCGNVTEVKLLTRDDGKSKGIAFVKFSKKSSFNKALEFNGSEHLGRNIVVEEAQGKKGGNFGQNNGFNNRGGQGNFGGQGGQRQFNNNRQQAPQGNANIETPTLFLGGLSYNSTVESIKDYFAQAGPVASARIVTDKETGKVFFYLFSPVDSDTLNFTMLIPPKRPTMSSMVATWTAETSDLTALPKETDPKADKEDSEAREVLEDKEDSEDPGTLETQPLSLVKMTRTPKRDRSVHSQERKFYYD